MYQKELGSQTDLSTPGAVEEGETADSNKSVQLDENTAVKESFEKDHDHPEEEITEKNHSQLKTDEPDEADPTDKAKSQASDDKLEEAPPAEIDRESLQLELQDISSKLADMKELFDECERKIEKASEVSDS